MNRNRKIETHDSDGLPIDPERQLVMANSPLGIFIERKSRENLPPEADLRRLFALLLGALEDCCSA